MNENGAAEKAGLQVGDVIVGADGKQVGSISELIRSRISSRPETLLRSQLSEKTSMSI